MKDESRADRAWRMLVADDLDESTAERISSFRASFDDPDAPRRRRSYAPEYFVHKIMENPAGRGYVSIAVDADDHLIGLATATRKLVSFRGEDLVAAEMGDAYTDPAWQRRGIYTTLRTACRERALADGVELLYSTPNPRSAPVARKGVFEPKSGLDWTMWVLPLRPSRIAATRFGEMCRNHLATVADRLWSRSVRAYAGLGPGRAEESDLQFDASFDLLDQRLRQRHSFMLKRDAAALRYRLVANPDRNQYGMVLHRDPSGTLEAVLIFKRTSQDGLDVFVVADHFGMTARALRHVWARAVSIAVEEDHDLVVTWASRKSTTLLAMGHVVALPVRTKPVVVYANDVGRGVLSDDGNWLFSILDTDNV